MMADTLSFNAKIGVVDFWVQSIDYSSIRAYTLVQNYLSIDRSAIVCVIPTADRNIYQYHLFLRPTGC